MFQLSEEGLKKVKSELARYEAKDSAIIPSLYIAQKENNGWVNEEVIHHLAKVMDIPEARINEVFKFYTMFNQKPVGRFHVQVCTNISCALNGARELASHLCKELKIGYDQVTEDSKFTISKVECLGSCGTAPMMQVNETYYENLTPESAMNILRGLK
jgi:NADH-quinone oxidoreductase subunit E